MKKIAMLDRKVSKKNAYIKKEYTKGYKIPIVSDTMFDTMIIMSQGRNMQHS